MMIYVNWQSPQPHDFSNRIDIWRISLKDTLSNEESSALVKFLDQEEREKAERFVFPAHRFRYIKAHAGLRQILAFYIKDSLPQALMFARGVHGKPTLHGPNHHVDWQFNLSHTENMALCIVAYRQSVGLDVEYLGRKMPDMLSLSKRFYAPEEYQTLLNARENLRAQIFYKLWTRKEALIKALGESISSMPLESFSVLNDALFNFKLQNFKPAENYIAAIAVPEDENKDQQLCFFDEI